MINDAETTGHPHRRRTGRTDEDGWSTAKASASERGRELPEGNMARLGIKQLLLKHDVKSTSDKMKNRRAGHPRPQRSCVREHGKKVKTQNGGE